LKIFRPKIRLKIANRPESSETCFAVFEKKIANLQKKSSRKKLFLLKESVKIDLKFRKKILKAFFIF